jgi:carboxymethylenebutenolidase
MLERNTDIETPQGKMTTFIVRPDGDGPFPVILFYMDAPAIREELYDMARRIAGEGYYVLLPDLFYRFGFIRFPFRNARTRIIWQAAIADMSNAEVMEDTRSMFAALDKDPAARKGPVGCIGFCMSGRLVTTAAGTFPDRIAAICSMYGVGIVTAKEDSPHFLVKDIRAECYFAFAETDATVPAYVIPTLRAELIAQGTNYALDVYPGTSHGFSFASRDIYDRDAAEKCWSIFFDMCARRVKER